MANTNQTGSQSAKFSTSQESEFKNALKPFLVQAVSGTIMGPLRRGFPPDVRFCRYYYGKYINDCWHSFNKRSDPYIVATFAHIFSLGIIKGSHCLFNWVLFIGEAMIGTLGLPQLTQKLERIPAIDDKREVVNERLNEVFETIYPFKFVQLPDCCGEGNCKNSYDGSDFVKILALSEDGKVTECDLSTPPKRSCAHCGGTKDLKKCTRCKVALYCNAQCQKSNWPLHKKTCKLPPPKPSDMVFQLDTGSSCKPIPTPPEVTDKTTVAELCEIFAKTCNIPRSELKIGCASSVGSYVFDDNAVVWDKWTKEGPFKFLTLFHNYEKRVEVPSDKSSQ